MPRPGLTPLILAICCVWSAAASGMPDQKMEPPRIVKRVEPIYPEAARRAGIKGDVTVEATIGIDGNVRDAKILQSIPQLDEPALAAVRQWEYAPATVDGVATPVIVTVKVSFALGAPAANVRTGGPLVLYRDAEDWTLNGTPLLDGNLRLRLAEAMRHEADKQLFVRLLDGTTYGQLVETLASALAAGVERLYVFDGADPEQAVRVSLEAVPATQTKVNLPAADAAASATKPASIISVPRAGATANARTALQRAGKGAAVRLEIDAARPIADVWEILRAAAAQGLDRVVLAVRQTGAAAPAKSDPAASLQSQGEWEKLAQTAAKLTQDNRLTEAIAMVEKFVGRHPTFSDARFQLGRLYELRSLSAPAATPAARSDLLSAAKHFAQAAELQADPSMRFVMIWKLARLYGPDELDDPAEAHRYARRLIAEHPDRAESHMVYARLLRDKGDIAAAAAVMRKGRAAATMPVPGLLMAAQYLLEQVQGSRELPRDTARSLLQEAIAITESIVMHPEKDDRDYRLATLAKSMALELEAERVAADRQQRVALLAESERWGAPIEQHRNGAPPPPRRLSAAEAADLEWRAVLRWNGRLADEGKLAEAIAGFQRYLAERPKSHAAHVEIAELLIRAAAAASDEKTRTANRDQAIAHLQRAIALAPTPAERDAASARMRELNKR